MSIFGMTSVIGIALGPFVGGAAQTHLNWRWIYWVSALAVSSAALGCRQMLTCLFSFNRFSSFLTLLCSRFSGSF
jgi:MFS family permease